MVEILPKNIDMAPLTSRISLSDICGRQIFTSDGNWRQEKQKILPLVAFDVTIMQ